VVAAVEREAVDVDAVRLSLAACAYLGVTVLPAAVRAAVAEAVRP
jgi:hypothetical protein